MPNRFANRTIAIVDDDPDILQSMELAFRHEGARVVTATDGTDGRTRRLRAGRSGAEQTSTGAAPRWAWLATS